ncbi:MAG: RMD1 family protein [Gammaproteobacteria bacterium]|nr:RMD1 family protein [Gammaproteobacteria bacterium]
MNNDNQQICRALCIAERFQFESLCQHLLSYHRGTRYRDALHLDVPNGAVFIFHYGVLVTWGLNKTALDDLLSEVNLFTDQPLAEPERESYSFQLGERTHMSSDVITLTTDTVQERLALSHGLAQSVKLNTYETRVRNTITSTVGIPETLARTGRTHLSRRAIAKIRGRLFLTKADVMLNYDLLDTPEFFWEYPELESYYEIPARYLELKQRIEVLTLKLGTIHELLEMLADEQKHQHSAFLEWIIIWLIALEIFAFVFHDILGWF